MKIFLILSILGLIYCEIKIPDEFLNAKDAIEAEGNKAAYENFKKSRGIEGRIVGESFATAGQFPYQALLYMLDNRGTSTCGGSLITYQMVLTAAHCIESFNTFHVYLGVISRNNVRISGYAEENIPRSLTHFHEAYHSYFLFNDIGLIYLPSATQNILNFPNIGLVALPTASDGFINLDGRNATVSGFGRDSSGSTTTLLKYANTPVVSTAVCKQTYGNSFVLDSVLCTNGGVGVGSCSGDSGGPVVTEIQPNRTVIIGLVSFGAAESCTSGLPSGNSRITSFLSWIDAHKNLTVFPSTTPRITTVPSTTRRPGFPGSAEISAKFSKLFVAFLISLVIFLK